MRIGVVCEGPSDFPAITIFLEKALRDKGIAPVFLPLYPEMDKTRPEGGWANVLLWLQNNPPENRIQRFFGGGLFAGALSYEPLSAIIMHLDADVIDVGSFRNFVRNNYNLEVFDTDDHVKRSEQIHNVLELAAKFESMTHSDVLKHVTLPAVEASEAWCVAAFHGQTENYELLRGQQLIDAFMSVLERSEGREPKLSYVNVDKSPERRSRFCERHASGFTRILNGCSQFSKTVTKLAAIAP